MYIDRYLMFYAQSTKAERLKVRLDLRFGPAHLSHCYLYGHCLVTLPSTMNETSKIMTHIVAHLTEEIILVVTV